MGVRGALKAGGSACTPENLPHPPAPRAQPGATRQTNERQPNHERPASPHRATPCGPALRGPALRHPNEQQSNNERPASQTLPRALACGPAPPRHATHPAAHPTTHPTNTTELQSNNERARTPPRPSLAGRVAAPAPQRPARPAARRSGGAPDQRAARVPEQGAPGDPHTPPARQSQAPQARATERPTTSGRPKHARAAERPTAFPLNTSTNCAQSGTPGCWNGPRRAANLPKLI